MDKITGGSDIGAKFSTDKLHLPPLRSLDDFLLASARFEIPNINDLEKWGNRVIKNLLYYQTNYFLLFIVIYVLLIAINPIKITMCLVLLAAVLATLANALINKPGSNVKFLVSRTRNTDNQMKWTLLAGSVLLTYFLLFWIKSLMLFGFVILFPVSLIFCHASLRLRNIKNKVVNTMESFGPSTPMGAFLDAINVKSDSN